MRNKVPVSKDLGFHQEWLQIEFLQLVVPAEAHMLLKLCGKEQAAER